MHSNMERPREPQGLREWQTQHANGAKETHARLPGGSALKTHPPVQEEGGQSLVPKTPWRRNGNPLQYSCLGNSMDRGDWWVTVHGVSESNTTEHTLKSWVEGMT